jgi:hypothetical protein
VGMDSASPGHHRTTCIWPNQSQKCAYKGFILYYVPEVVNTSLHVHFVVVVMRCEGMQWRAAQTAKRSLHDADKRPGKNSRRRTKMPWGTYELQDNLLLTFGVL